VDFPGDNAVSLTARIDGVDASSLGALETSAGSMAVTALDARVTTHGLFEGYLLMPLGNLLLAGAQDPGAELGRLVALGQGLADSLPDPPLDAPSRAALKALLGDLPHPSGTVALSLTADPGIGPARFAPVIGTGLPDFPSGLAPLLDGVRVTATYTRSDAPN
jgi:hypothetical protein